MKNTSMQVYKLATLLVLLLFVNCQKEEITKELQTVHQEQIATRNTVSSGDIPEVMEFLRSKSNDKLEFKFSTNKTYSASNDPHVNDIVITQAMEDQIVQVVKDGKSNYAFKTKEKFPNYFLNLIVVQTISGYYMYFAKYVPSIETNWDGNSLDTFEGAQYVYSDTGKFRKKYYYSNGTRGMIPCECPSGEEEDDGGGDGDGCQTELWWICNTFGYLHRDFMQCNCVEQENCTGFIPISIEVCDGINPTSIQPNSINYTSSEECYCWIEEGSTGGSGGGTGGGNNNNCPNVQPCANELEELNEFCQCELAVNPITPVNPEINFAKEINTCLGSNFTIDEINTLNANPTIEQLYNYLSFDNFGNCNPDNPEFAELAAEALLEGGEFDEEENIIYENSLNNYPCHKLIIEESIGVCSPLTQAVLDIFEANDGSNLIFKTSNAITGNANTTVFSNYDATTHTCNTTITFNEAYLQTATDISIARTSIHESLHAIFVYMHEENLLDSPNGTPIEGFENFVEAYVNYLSGLPANFGVAHHELMADFVEDMATSLSIYSSQNGYSHSFNFYKKLCWAGLTSTDAFLTLYPKYLDPNDEINNPTNYNPEWLDIKLTIQAEIQSSSQIFIHPNGNTYQFLPKGNQPNSNEPCN